MGARGGAPGADLPEGPGRSSFAPLDSATLIKNRGRPSWDFVGPSPRPSSALPPPGPPPLVRDKMAPNPASNPHILGPKGQMGAHVGLIGFAFSVRSNLVSRCFAQNSPKDRENPLFQRLWPILGLKAAKSFQCASREGGTKSRKRKINRSIFDENTSLETATKNEIKPFFRFFGGQIFFIGCGIPEFL